MKLTTQGYIKFLKEKLKLVKGDEKKEVKKELKKYKKLFKTLDND